MVYLLKIVALKTVGDGVRISAVGSETGDAHWRPMRRVSLEAPQDEGAHYRIGQQIRVTVEGWTQP
jgi:hypothetical protein